MLLLAALNWGAFDLGRSASWTIDSEIRGTEFRIQRAIRQFASNSNAGLYYWILILESTTGPLEPQLLELGFNLIF